jgi:hypothetical protein
VRAQELKLEPSALKRPRVEAVFSPVCGCEDKGTAGLVFGLRRASRVDAQMIDSDARIVRTLLDGATRRAGRLRLDWDGRDDAGRLVPDGPYRLRLVLDEEREVVVPRPVRVDTRAPRAALIQIAPRAIAAAARERGRRRGVRRREPRAAAITVRYRSTEAGRATLLVDGVTVLRTARRPSGGRSLRWDGRLDGRALSAGVYELSVRVRDRAGNSSPVTRSLPLRVRRPR